MFAEAIESLLQRECTPAAVRAIESGGSAQALAAAVADSGFHDLLAAEDQGGGGATWRDFFEVVTLCGYHAAPLPLAQTMASRLLLTADETPTGLVTFAPAISRGADGSLRALHVPAARTSQHVIGRLDEHLVLLSVSQAHQMPSGSHGSLAASLRWSANAGLVLSTKVTGPRFEGLGALLHAGLLAGAMKHSFDLTMTYANERVQFGKSIGRFQAIQHQMSVMAEQVAAARMATEAAFGTGHALPAMTACAVAKARTSEAAPLVASTAHAVHGAIGVTEEYDLQLFTRRLHEWRMAHGSETHWHRLLGHLFLGSGMPLAADFARELLEPSQA